MPLRVAIVTQAYHPAVGGVTEHVDATALALRDRGHHVVVVTSRFGRGEIQSEHVRRIGRNVVIPYNGAENNVTIGFGLDRRLRALFQEERIDVIHVHCPLSPTLPLLALRVATQPIVGTFHSTSSSDLPFRLLRRQLLPYYRRIDRALAVSETAHEFVARHFSGPVEILPNGVNLDRFRPGLKRLERFEDDTPNILFVGRHDPRKGLPELLTACEWLAARGARFRLIVVGDGRLRRRVERMASGALLGRVHFEGRVSNEHLPWYYASADIFCSPARGGESFGIVLLEAMASGVPVVATDLPGYRTVLTSGKEGLTVPPRNPRALADALELLLERPDLRSAMGARGIETAKRYAWPLIVTRLEEIYHSLLSRPPAAPGTGDAPDAAPEFEPAGV